MRFDGCCDTSEEGMPRVLECGGKPWTGEGDCGERKHPTLDRKYSMWFTGLKKQTRCGIKVSGCDNHVHLKTRANFGNGAQFMLHTHAIMVSNSLSFLKLCPAAGISQYVFNIFFILFWIDIIESLLDSAPTGSQVLLMYTWFPFQIGAQLWYTNDGNLFALKHSSSWNTQHVTLPAHASWLWPCTCGIIRLSTLCIRFIYWIAGWIRYVHNYPVRCFNTLITLHRPWPQQHGPIMPMLTFG